MRNVQRIIESRGGFAALADHPIRINNEPYMRLCIERVGVGPRGLPIVSVAHYFEQNGDLCRDPDIVFEVLTEVVNNHTLVPAWLWYPISFTQDLGFRGPIHQELVWEQDGRIYQRPDQLRGVKAFCRTWNTNIGQQGFVKAAQQQRQEV